MTTDTDPTAVTNAEPAPDPGPPPWERPYHRRLREWEAFDEIRFKVVPRYKTSGLSGDEWRQHVQVDFLHKGEVVHEAGFNRMERALPLALSEYFKATCPISERLMALEDTLCDQPSCTKAPVGRFLLKRLTSEQGDFLDPADQPLRYYRKFCAEHLRRGDCSREDCDDNYEPLDQAGPEQSTNIVESPSTFGGVVTATPETLPDVIGRLTGPDRDAP